jgi:alcohol dehydrogenase
VLAALADRYGGADAVRIGETPEPRRDGQVRVRVRVRATSLNPLDAKLLAGSLRPFLNLRFPAILGFDLAGEVESADDTSGFQVGERVYGRIDRTTGGTHAELAVVGASVLDRIPAALSYEQAAALPLVGMTALQALRDIARLRPGQRLLVNGAAGGVGSHAVQIGRALGAQVAAVVSPDAAPLAHRLGAEPVVAKSGIEALAPGFDVVFDTVFSRPYRDFVRLLGERGIYVTTGFSPAVALRSVLGRLVSTRRVAFVISRADGGLMRDLSALVSAGRLEPVIDSTWPLGRIRHAYARLEAGHLRGKIVVTIPPDGQA